MEKERSDKLCDAEMLFHMLLFAYEKSVRDILATGHVIFVHPTLSLLREISEKEGIDLTKAKTVDEAFERFSSMLKDSGLVKEVQFEKLGPDKYMLHVDKCIYAKRLHQSLKPLCKDATCRYALIAMAILEKFCNSNAKLNTSDFTPEGTKTIIECLSKETKQ